MRERVQTLHPDPDKQGVNIRRDLYDTMRAAIRATIAERGEVGFGELTEAVGERLDGRFEGSIGWYVTTVKLDLEARGEIERLPGRGPQRLRLVDAD